MANKVTMSMIAQRAQVSQPTVSIVLNNSDTVSISEETRKRVLDAARELGYIRKSKRRSCELKQVALIIDGSLYCYDHFLLTLNAAMERALELNVSLKVVATLSSREGERLIRDEISGGSYDAVIVATNMTSEKCTFTSLSVPAVYLNCMPQDESSVIAVLPDDYDNASRMTKALAPHYRHPLIIGGDAWMKATRDRIKAITEVYAAQNISLLPDDIQYCSWSFREACSIVMERLREEPGYDIIYCASDYVAMGVYHGLSHMGLRPGRDIAVAGYDNQAVCRELSPQLTSVELPYEKMARTALEYAYALASGKQVKKDKIRTVTGELFIRASTPLARPHS